MVVVEAEHSDQLMEREGHTWTLGTTGTGFAGSGYMEGLPDNGANYGSIAEGPVLSYRVNFTTTGTYYVWVRGNAPNTNADTVHTGIDGQAVATGDTMKAASWRNGYGWGRSLSVGIPATLVVSTPGVHSIDFGIKEDGFRFDRFLLTTSSETISGQGPVESVRH